MNTVDNIIYSNKEDDSNINNILNIPNYNKNFSTLLLNDTQCCVVNRNIFTNLRVKTNIVQISAGHIHTVFLENTGQVLACGRNDIGQLGDNRNPSPQVDKYVPVYVLRGAQSGTTTNLQNIVQISLGGNHTLFLENTGKVLACGRNFNNQLGDSTNVDKYTPVYVLSGSQSASGTLQNIVQISGGVVHTVFLENTGQVLACGWNDYGELGDNRNPSPQVNKYVPVYVLRGAQSGTSENLQNIVQISAGYYFTTIFLENTGQVLACGRNDYGQLGDNRNPSPQVNKYVPVYVLRGAQSGTATNLQNIVQISTRGYHTVFLENTGQVLACGANSAGQLGDNRNSSPQVDKYVPVYVLRGAQSGTSTNLQNIVQISAGSSHTVFLENTGQVLACGRNDAGQLGDNRNPSPQVDKYVPVYVLTLLQSASENLQNIVQISGGSSYTVFLENTGKVLACGTNVYGILGDNRNPSPQINKYIPVYSLTSYNSNLNIVNYVYTLPFAANVVVTSSYNNIIFVNNSDNAVCIGYNYNNMFGNLLANNTFIDISSSGSLTNVINVAVGISHCILLLKNNTAYGVGNNFYGQLGTNDARKRYRPTLVSGANNSSIINIKCGENYSIFLKTNNTAFGCGLNTSGQLGVGNTVNQTVMTIVTGSLSISNAECGANHTIFLTTTYKIYTCGLNTFGQLGNGTNTNRSSPTAILTTFEFDLIDCGKNHTIVVTRDRLNIYTFGNNNLGQLFVPITTTSTFTPQNFVLTKKIIYIYSNAFLDKTYILTNNVTQISLLDLILLYQY